MKIEQMQIRMGEMAAEIERLNAEREQLMAQEPVGHISGVNLFCRPVYPLYQPLLCELYQVLGALDAGDIVLDQVSAAAHMRSLPHKTLLPYFAKAVPAQQVDRQTIIDVLLSVGNMSEGVIADAIIGAIGAQQSPAVAAPSVEAFAAIIDKAVQLYSHKWSDEFCDVTIGIMKTGMGYIYPEGLIEFAKQIRSGEVELPRNLDQSPRITEQESFEIILSFYWFMENFKNKNGRNPSVIEWYEDEGRSLPNKLNAHPLPAQAIPEGYAVEWHDNHVIVTAPDNGQGLAYADETFYGFIKAMLSASPKP